MTQACCSHKNRGTISESVISLSCVNPRVKPCTLEANACFLASLPLSRPNELFWTASWALCAPHREDTARHSEGAFRLVTRPLSTRLTISGDFSWGRDSKGRKGAGERRGREGDRQSWIATRYDTKEDGGREEEGDLNVQGLYHTNE